MPGSLDSRYVVSVYAASLCSSYDKFWLRDHLDSGAPNSSRDAVLLDCRFLGDCAENLAIPETVLGRSYLQQWREVWIIHGSFVGEAQSFSSAESSR